MRRVGRTPTSRFSIRTRSSIAPYPNSAQDSEGVSYVIVNGTVVLDAGEFVSGATPGQPILSNWRDNDQRTP